MSVCVLLAPDIDAGAGKIGEVAGTGADVIGALAGAGADVGSSGSGDSGSVSRGDFFSPGF